MKTEINYFTGVLLLLLLSISCEKEITNPFDPDCPKEIWTPANFKAVQSENKLDLTWKQENMNITGFKIDRKVGTLDWSNVASTGKTATSWSDSDLKGGEVHQYRLYAYADENSSNTVTAQATPVFTASLTTGVQTDLTCNSATLGGSISNTGGATITERGIVYAKTANPTTSNTKVTTGNGEGSFNQSVTGLEETTTYYVRAFAINSAGTSYGNQISFTTPPCAVPATVTTSAPANVTFTSAMLGGNVTDDGGATVTERGIVYAKTASPTTSNTKIAIGSGQGSFNQLVTGLEETTIYYVRAFAINSAGTSYGNQISFTTSARAVPATVTTMTPTNVTHNSAILGGNVTDDGEATVTERGIVYSKTSNPTTLNTKVVMGSGTGAFSQTVSGLTSDTRYYVKSYAINSAGTSYGIVKSFNTEKQLTGTFTDARDGNTYKWVKIGDQIWMAENLAYLPSINRPTDESTSSPKYYVYGYGTNPLIKISVFSAKTTLNYQSFGILYNWPAAMAACPKGWHLPTDDEWEQLAKYISNDNGGYRKTGDDWLEVGKHLKSKTGWKENGNGTDNYYFSGLPGGYRNDADDKFYGIDYSGFWWSATGLSPTAGWFRVLGYDYTSFVRLDTSKECGFSVRCVKD